MIDEDETGPDNDGVEPEVLLGGSIWYKNFYDSISPIGYQQRLWWFNRRVTTCWFISPWPLRLSSLAKGQGYGAQPLFGSRVG